MTVNKSLFSPGWEPMQPGHIDRVLAIADTVHQDYPEDRAIFAERLALFPAGCGVAVMAGEVIGYRIMHPGKLGQAPGLNKLLGALPAAADCLYIHDIALLAEARRSGLGKAAAFDAMGIAAAHGFVRVALIATPGALAYWRKSGFDDYPDPPDLSGYGTGLTYLWRPVPAP